MMCQTLKILQLATRKLSITTISSIFAFCNQCDIKEKMSPCVRVKVNKRSGVKNFHFHFVAVNGKGIIIKKIKLDEV